MSNESEKKPNIDMAELQAMNEKTVVNRSKRMNEDQLLADLRATRADAKSMAFDDFKIGQSLNLA